MPDLPRTLDGPFRRRASVEEDPRATLCPLLDFHDAGRIALAQHASRCGSMIIMPRSMLIASAGPSRQRRPRAQSRRKHGHRRYGCRLVTLRLEFLGGRLDDLRACVFVAARLRKAPATLGRLALIMAFSDAFAVVGVVLAIAAVALLFTGKIKPGAGAAGGH
jgi:hypothetical protein